MLRVQYAQLMFYVREGYWHHAEQLCTHVVNTTDDWLFRVWRGLCYDEQGMRNEAMADYKAAEPHRQTTLPARMGMYLAHKRSRDADAMTALEGSLHDDKHANDVDAWTHAAALCWASGNVHMARDILVRYQDARLLHEHRNEYTSLATVRAWVDLCSGRSALLEKCGQLFLGVLDREAALARDDGGDGGDDALLRQHFATADNDDNDNARDRTSRQPGHTSARAATIDLDAALGRVAYLERKYQLYAAQELLHRVIVAYPALTLPLVVKARLLMRAEDWEQAMDTVRRVLDVERDNLEALALTALHPMVKEGRYAAAAPHMTALLAAVQRGEPRNAALLHRCAQAFSRLCATAARHYSGGSNSGGAASGGNEASMQHLLGIARRFAEQACSLAPSNGEYLCELGMTQYYAGDYKAALTTLQRAAALTDSLSPLLGTVACHMQLGNNDAAVRQLALCREFITPAGSGGSSSSSIGRDGSSSGSSFAAHAELHALGGMLAWRVDRDEARALQCLDQAADALRRELSMQLHVGLELYTHLHLPLMLQVAREYMQHTRSEPPEPRMRQSNAVVQQCQRHLELLLRYVPGCAEAQLLLARVHFVAGDVAQTQTLLRHTLAQDAPLPEAYLFSAQVCHYCGHTKLARAALEQALMLDFGIRDEPYYHLLLGMVQGQLQQHDAAVDTLRTALRLVRAQHGSAADTAAATSNNSSSSSKRAILRPLSVSEHVTLYLQLAQAQLRARDVDAARTTLAEAADAFARSGQLARVTMAQAMLAARTDVEQSIALLRQVPASSSYFVVARAQAAKLYLAQLHNPVQYLRCFEEVVQQMPTAEAYVELGEAYSTVQEPEKAIAAYERAKTLLDPHNSELAVRIGRQLVAMHDYGKAIRYYEDALAADATLFAVRADLAMLLWHLGDTARAVQCVRDAPVLADDAAATSGTSDGSSSNSRAADDAMRPSNGSDATAATMTAAMAKEDTATAVERVNCGLLLYKLYKGHHSNNNGAAGGGGGGGGALHDALAALTRTRTWQLHVLTHKLHDSTRETVLQQKRILATIDTELARTYMTLMSDSNNNSSSNSNSNNDGYASRARACLREALQHDEVYEEAMLTLAQLHLRCGDLDACEQQCQALLRLSPDRDDAVLLQSTVQLRRGLHDEAATLLQQLLTRHPERHEVLVAYTRLLCRAGRLSDVAAQLDAAVARVPAGQRPSPGLSYARGLYARASCNHAEALRAFNAARTPADNAWAEAALTKMIDIYLVPTTEDMWVDGWSMEEKSDNVRSAEVLLHYLPAGATRQTLQAYCLLATKRPHDVERAMHLFLTVIGNHIDNDNGNNTTTTPRSRSAGRATTTSASAPTSAGAATRALVDEDEDDLLLRELQHSQRQQQQPQRNGADDSVSSGGSGVAQRGRAAVRSAGSTHSAAGGSGGGSGGGGGRAATLAEVLQPAESNNNGNVTPAQPALAFLGLAIALYLSQQETAARRVLERLLPPPTTTAADDTSATTTATATTMTTGTTVSVSDDDAEVLERALMLRAHMDVHAGALDTAQATLRGVLEQNKSCSAAWHALGALCERQQRHAEASSCYKRAWRLVNEADPAVGYRLALNYLKGGSAVKALDVCKRVLAKYPNYPRIEDDVMAVACTMLRP